MRDTIVDGKTFFGLLCNSGYQHFNNECLYRFDSLQQKLFIRIPNDSTTRLAVDFTLPAGSDYTSYISLSISPVVFLGDTHFVYDGRCSYTRTYQFSDIVGFKHTNTILEHLVVAVINS